MKPWQKITVFIGASVAHFVLSVFTLVREEMCSVSHHCTLLDRVQSWLFGVPYLWIVAVLRKFNTELFLSIPALTAVIAANSVVVVTAFYFVFLFRWRIRSRTRAQT
jgi:uncharacterized membrane protein